MRYIKCRKTFKGASKTIMVPGLLLASVLAIGGQVEAHIGSVTLDHLNANQVLSSGCSVPNEDGKPWWVVDEHSTEVCEHYINCEIRLRKGRVYLTPDSAIPTTLELTRTDEFLNFASGTQTETLHLGWNQSKTKGRINVWSDHLLKFDRTPDSNETICFIRPNAPIAVTIMS